MTDSAFCKLLTDLLNVNGHSKDERRIADFILKYCKTNGIEAREDKSASKTGGNAGNILAWPKGVNPDKVKTMFASHMDTVDVGPSRKLKFSGSRIESASEWPIGIDNRLGNALMLRLLTEKPGNYVCAFTTQEEIGMFGAEELAVPKNIKQIFNLDGSQEPGHFVLSTVGCVTFKVTLTGQSSHAGIAPNEGKSVIAMASKAIAELPLGMPGNDESINIGVINAGTRSNVIPSKAEIIGEVRAGSLKKTEQVVKKVMDTFKKWAKKYGGSMSWQREDMFKPYLHKATSPIAQRSIKAIKSSGLVPRYNHYRGGSDANVFNNRGIDSVNLSIAARNPHSPKEHADFKEIAKAWKIVEALSIGD
ncbi:MAG: M20/M25/M40 family metallo-hydrolase [Fibrobacteres bacterium]|nr:M20/M25/M40 family metallo-hydrolase [Fibrobacterota bacterium]